MSQKNKMINREGASDVKLQANVIELIHRADTIVLLRSDKFAVHGHSLCLSFEYDPKDANAMVTKMGVAAMIADYCLEFDKVIDFEQPSEGTLLMVASIFDEVEINELVGRLVPDPLDPMGNGWHSFIPASREHLYNTGETL